MTDSTKRRVFDQEFKRDAVKLIVEGGRRLRDVSRDLGIHENVLQRWKSQYLEDRSTRFPARGT